MHKSSTGGPCWSSTQTSKDHNGDMMLHVVTVYSAALSILYIFLCVTCSVFHHSHNSLTETTREPYTPLLCASVSNCLNTLPVSFFSKPNLASLSLCSRRHTNFLISLLLFISGSVELNPGPSAAPSLQSTLSIFDLLPSLTMKWTSLLLSRILSRTRILIFFSSMRHGWLLILHPLSSTS